MTDGWRDLPTMADVAAAQAAGDEIEIGIASMKGGCLVYSYEKWRGKYWDTNCKFSARPAQPKMKKVKLLAFLGAPVLQFVREDSIDLQIYAKNTRWIRQPHLDLEEEVPE